MVIICAAVVVPAAAVCDPKAQRTQGCIANRAPFGLPLRETYLTVSTTHAPWRCECPPLLCRAATTWRVAPRACTKTWTVFCFAPEKKIQRERYIRYPSTCCDKAHVHTQRMKSPLVHSWWGCTIVERTTLSCAGNIASRLYRLPLFACRAGSRG